MALLSSLMFLLLWVLPPTTSCSPGSSRTRFSGGSAAVCGDFWGVCESSQDGHRNSGIHRTLCQLPAARKQGTRTTPAIFIFICWVNWHVSVDAGLSKHVGGKTFCCNFFFYFIFFKKSILSALLYPNTGQGNQLIICPGFIIIYF